MVAAVAEDVRLEQIVFRVGMPPTTPADVQSILRVEAIGLVTTGAEVIVASIGPPGLWGKEADKAKARLRTIRMDFSDLCIDIFLEGCYSSIVIRANSQNQQGPKVRHISNLHQEVTLTLDAESVVVDAHPEPPEAAQKSEDDLEAPVLSWLPMLLISWLSFMAGLFMRKAVWFALFLLVISVVSFFACRRAYHRLRREAEKRHS